MGNDASLTIIALLIHIECKLRHPKNVHVSRRQKTAPRMNVTLRTLDGYEFSGCYRRSEPLNPAT